MKLKYLAILAVWIIPAITYIAPPLPPEMPPIGAGWHEDDGIFGPAVPGQFWHYDDGIFAPGYGPGRAGWHEDDGIFAQGRNQS